MIHLIAFRQLDNVSCLHVYGSFTLSLSLSRKEDEKE